MAKTYEDYMCSQPMRDGEEMQDFFDQELRNWIEKETGKRIVCSPTYVGIFGGREVFALDFEDGTEMDAYIDWFKHKVESVFA